MHYLDGMAEVVIGSEWLSSIMEQPTIHRLSEQAVTICWPAVIDVAVHAQVMALDAMLAADPFPGWVENVPAYHTLTVYYDPLRSRLDVEEWIARILNTMPEVPAAGSGKKVRIPVHYGYEQGPDLVAAAQQLGLSPAALIELHTSSIYRVFMIGFLPGFPYMGLLHEALRIPRKSTPALQVPAGSVAIAGMQTGIYPVASPGGWHVIGRTDVQLFEAGKSLLQPGDEVEFYPIKQS